MHGNAKPAPYTRRMLKRTRTMSLRINMNIVRSGSPRVGHLIFDKQDRLVYITEQFEMGDEPRFYRWRRVFTSGSLSRAKFRGRYDPDLKVVKEETM